MKHLVIASLATAALFVAACSGGGTPTQTGATPGQTSSVAPATGPTASAEPIPTAGVTATPAGASPTPASSDSAGASPSAATSSAPTPSGPVDVEALVPTEAGGITLTPESIAIDDFLGAYEEYGPVLSALGKSPDDATIVQAQGTNAGEVMIVQAFRVAGADPGALMNAIMEFWEVSDDEAAPMTIGGKEIIVQGHPDTQAQYKKYYYSYGDVVFKLGYNGDNFDEQMAALASELP